MENKLTPELLEKAKLAKSAEELIALAKENGEQLTAEEANTYFAQLHKSGELADDELDQVAGGCDDDDDRERCHGYPVIQSTSTETCEYFSERFDYGIVSGPCDDCYYCCKWWEKPVCKCSKRQ